MTNWMDWIHGAEFARSLGLPADALSSILLREVVVHRDGPSMLLRLHVPAQPSTPPSHWPADAAGVSLTLDLEARALSITGTAEPEMGSLSVERHGSEVQLAYSSPSLTIRAHGGRLALRDLRPGNTSVALR